MNYRQANWNLLLVSLLKVAAISIAIPRTMGLSVAMLGVSAKHEYPLLVVAELWSGLGLAILEGIAIAYVFSKWKHSKQDKVLTSFIVAFVLTWPLVFAPYLVAEQDGLTMSELAGTGLLGISLRLLWSGLVATLPMLIVAGVGYADSVVEGSRGLVESKQDEVEASRNLVDVKQPAKKSSSVNFDLSNPASFPCICGKVFSSKQALGGHSRHCKGVDIKLLNGELK